MSVSLYKREIWTQTLKQGERSVNTGVIMPPARDLPGVERGPEPSLEPRAALRPDFRPQSRERMKCSR